MTRYSLILVLLLLAACSRRSSGVVQTDVQRLGAVVSSSISAYTIAIAAIDTIGPLHSDTPTVRRSYRTVHIEAVRLDTARTVDTVRTVVARSSSSERLPLPSPVDRWQPPLFAILLFVGLIVLFLTLRRNS